MTPKQTNNRSSKDLSVQADKIFIQALQIESESDRMAFVKTACADNQLLVQEVERLFTLQLEAPLLAEKEQNTRITAIDVANTITSIPDFFENMKDVLPDDDEVGKQIGNYKLLQKIGEGGVGNVYLAEQLKPVRRQVAFKIIKAGMDTKSVIARFEAERQALALMEHPNIAHVLNAGETETGRPYFVMELVHGERITTYCNEHRMPVTQRLELFIQVCHAIQHAHQKGIIHRDIKPSNVLIKQHDGVPSPVVIDFGIAKATGEDLLTEKTVNTSLGPFIGTPAYMSPEQADSTSTDIDTRSDTYSLGALLYEILTGQPPFDQRELLKSGLEEMCRTLRECDPLMPSVQFNQNDAETQKTIAEQRGLDARKLGLMLPGDLDGIVMMALEKDRSRRYETVNTMAMDIEHFLNNEPVMARVPSRFYRFQKLVRRNKTTFTYLSLLTAALIAGLGTSTWLFFREREARMSERLARQSEQKLLIEADAREKIGQAALLLTRNRNQPAEAEAIMNTIQIPVVEPSLEAANVFRELGLWHAQQGRWVKASEYFSKLIYAVRVDKTDKTELATTDLLRTGPTLIIAGKMQAYHSFVDEMLIHFEGTRDPVAAEQIIKVSLIVPTDKTIIEQLAPMEELLKKSMEGIPENEDSYRFAWRDLSLALLEYRRGNYNASISWAEKSLDAENQHPPRVAMTHLLLSMCHTQQGHQDRAQPHLDMAEQSINRALPDGLKRIPDLGNYTRGFWHDWVIGYLLQQEAQSLTDLTD